MKTIICLAGPTASGKTELSEELAGLGPFRLISVDSMQVYRGMDIGTGKPGFPRRRAWGLVDVADPGETFSAGRFRALAEVEINAAWRQGQVPLLAGGTGLYFKALFEGLSDIPPVDSGIRQEIERRLDSLGLAALAKELEIKDPVTAAKTDLKNPRRVQRALEVYHSSGKSLSFWQSKKGRGIEADQVLWFGLDPGKAELLRRIEDRVGEMFRRGWIEEARFLEKRWGRATVLKTGALGYAVVFDLLDDKMDQAEAARKIAVLTRQYARRQMTWFKKDDFINWKSPQACLEEIKMRLEKAWPLSYNGRH